MGKASRDKWIKRAEVYEGVILKGDQNTSKDYVDRFSPKKLSKLVKGANELEAEKDMEEKIVESMGSEEGEGDEPQD